MKYTFIQKNEKVLDVDTDAYSGNVENILKKIRQTCHPKGIMEESSDFKR